MKNKKLQNADFLAAAIQADTQIGNTQHNIEHNKALAEAAVKSGATWIGLPEFFNTGIGWFPDLIDKIETEEGPSAQFMRDFSREHEVVIGGSLMCRIPSGAVRNRYLCFQNGKLVGKHDKDLPTMWEAAFYEESSSDDTGELGSIDDIRVGAAVCWEFMRTQTARRMQGLVDVIIGGSHWWSLPKNWPKFLVEKQAQYNRALLSMSVSETARLIGAPVIHGSHCNELNCSLLGFPMMRYEGVLEGNAMIIDGYGRIMTQRKREEGPGYAMTKVTPGNVGTEAEIPDDFWLFERGWLPAFAWNYHGLLGRQWYRKHVKQSESQLSTQEGLA